MTQLYKSAILVHWVEKKRTIEVLKPQGTGRHEEGKWYVERKKTFFFKINYFSEKLAEN